MVITGNSRLLMPNVPITLWYVTPSLSYPDYFLSILFLFYYCSQFLTHPHRFTFPYVSLCLFRMFLKHCDLSCCDWNWRWEKIDVVQWLQKGNQGFFLFFKNMKEKTNKQAVLGPFHDVIYSRVVDREETAATAFWKPLLEHLVKCTETQSTGFTLWQSKSCRYLDFTGCSTSWAISESYRISRTVGNVSFFSCLKCDKDPHEV